MTEDYELERVRRIHPRNKYHNIIPFDTSGEGRKKRLYRAGWGGLNGRTRPVIIYTNKIGDPDVERYEAKGLGVGNEITVLTPWAVDECLENCVNPLLDYNEGEGIQAFTAPEYSGSLSLRRWIEENGVLSGKQFQEVFSCVFKGADFFIKNKYYHRDHNPSNILIREVHQRLEARVIDPGSAIDTARADAVPVHSTLARFSMDPLIGGVFTTEYRKYSQASEVYAIAMNAITALTGKPPVYYDHRRRIAMDNHTGESLLDEHGDLIPEKHMRAVDRSIKQIPWFTRLRHKRWIRNGLSVNPNDRYESLCLMRADFDRGSDFFGLKELWRDSIGLTITCLLGAGVVGGVLMTEHGLKGKYKAELEQVRTEEARYDIGADGDGEGLGLNNNFVNLEITAVSGTNYNYPKKTSYIKANPGEKVSLNVYLRENGGRPAPRDGNVRGLQSLRGRAYIEGSQLEFEEDKNRRPHIANDIKIPILGPDRSEWLGWGMGGVWPSEPVLTVPSNSLHGTYIVAVEAYQPVDGKTEDETELCKELDPRDPGKMLVRKRIPLIVGSPEKAIDLNYAYFSSDRSLIGPMDILETDKKRIEGKGGYAELNGKYSFEISVPEEEIYRRLDNSNSIGLFLPSSRDEPNWLCTDTRTLQILARDQNNAPAFYTAVPIRRKILRNVNTGEPVLSWFELGVAGPEFSEQLYKYRKDLESGELEKRAMLLSKRAK